jgi:protein SCO1
MNHLNPTRRGMLTALGALGAIACAPVFAHDGHHAALPADTQLPDESVYRLDAKLTDQDGREFTLASLRGQPLIVSMFYSSCQMVCPMIFETAHATLKALPAADRKDVRVLMVSFDPARDSVAVLKDTYAKRSCDSQWTLARADESTSRKVAAVLGVQYRKLADGEYNHSTQLALLDRNGKIAARSGKLGPADAEFVKRVHEIVSAKHG